MEPRAGTVLVATTALTDPNFAAAIVYLLEHGDGGTLGLVVNRPLATTLGEVWSDAPAHLAHATMVATGGPVEPHKGLLLHGDPAIPAAQDLGGGVHIGGAIPDLLRRWPDGPDDLGPRLYLGHSGWAPGQLDMEVQDGAWLVRPGRLAWLLAGAPDGLWERLRTERGGLPEPSVN